MLSCYKTDAVNISCVPTSNELQNPFQSQRESTYSYYRLTLKLAYTLATSSLMVKSIYRNRFRFHVAHRLDCIIGQTAQQTQRKPREASHYLEVFLR